MKKSLLLILVIIATLGLLTLSGCKKNDDYDITGTWYLTLDFGDYTANETYTFVGNDRSGDVLWEGQALGTYSVVGESVSFTVEYINQDDEYTVEVYNGSFDNDRQMSGSFTITIEGLGSASGTWWADR
jgi:hypothetical protein